MIRNVEKNMVNSQSTWRPPGSFLPRRPGKMSFTVDEESQESHDIPLVMLYNVTIWL